MILKCPACSARFRVDPHLLQPDGRRVQCAKCKHRWHADPPPEELLEEAEETAPPAAKPGAAGRSGAGGEDDTREAAYDEEDSYDEDAEYDDAGGEEDYGEDAEEEAEEEFDDNMSFGAAGGAPEFGDGAEFADAKPAAKKPRRRPRALAARKRLVPILWGLVALAVLGLAGVLWFGRAPLMALLPALAPVYALVGAGEEDPLAGLELRDIKTGRVTEAGVEFLEVAGLVVNAADAPRTIPPLVMVLSDGEGLTIQQWMFPADSTFLPAGASTAFSARMPNPSPMARDIRIEFTPTSDDR